MRQQLHRLSKFRIVHRGWLAVTEFLHDTDRRSLHGVEHAGQRQKSSDESGQQEGDIRDVHRGAFSQEPWRV